MKHIPYGRQDINQHDIDSVVEILKSDFLTQGPSVPRFEALVAEYCKAEHALAVNSATSALHIACLALGVGPGDYVWTTPVTFVASANCALYCGATIDFVDIDAKTFNMSVAELEKKLVLAQASGNLPKVVIPVHLSGQSCDMEGIAALAKQYGFSVIEDASHAIGGRYKNEPIGNCRYSDITVFSFHPVKIITTAEGGLATTNNSVLAKKMNLFRSHGITRDLADMTHEPDGPWYYQQIELGYNYRMTELQAALGVSQMQRLDEFVARRHEIANRYNELLSLVDVLTPLQCPDSYSALHLYIIQIKQDSRVKHLEFFEKLRDANIGVNLHYIPVYLQPYYKKLNFNEGYCPEAEDYYARSVSLPMYANLTIEQQKYIVETITTIFNV